MLEQLDLLGEPVMRRSAFFPWPDIRRALGRRWGPGPIACVIGCNPSNAGADRDDPTSLWWNRWFAHWGFGGYDAVNFYSFVSSDPNECRERVRAAFAGEWGDRDELFANRDYVTRKAKAADQVFVCFGNIANEIDHEWNETVLEEIQTGEAPWPDLWCWGTTKTGAPTHPMARGKHRIDPLQAPILWRAGHA